MKSVLFSLMLVSLCFGQPQEPAEKQRRDLQVICHPASKDARYLKLCHDFAAQLYNHWLETDIRGSWMVFFLPHPRHNSFVLTATGVLTSDKTQHLIIAERGVAKKVRHDKHSVVERALREAKKILQNPAALGKKDLILRMPALRSKT